LTSKKWALAAFRDYAAWVLLGFKAARKGLETEPAH
jgi:hypothetical protein